MVLDSYKKWKEWIKQHRVRHCVNGEREREMKMQTLKTFQIKSFKETASHKKYTIK